MPDVWTCTRCGGTFGFVSLDQGEGSEVVVNGTGFKVRNELEVGGVPGSFCRPCAEVVEEDGVLWERMARGSPKEYRAFVQFVYDGLGR